MLFNLALEYAITEVQVNQDGLKLYVAHKLLVHADDLYIYIYIYTYIYIYILGRSIHTVKKNRETLVVVSKETGLEVNADKSSCMAMSPDQNTGCN